MIISKIALENWRNFESVEVDLTDRVFVVGPNAAGKSNFMDAFRFLRDIALPRGGLQEAINQRGGVPKIRSLSARKKTDISITIELKDPSGDHFRWKYSIGIKLEQRGSREPYLVHETVWKDGGRDPIMSRPNDEDIKDPKRRSQTYLEQVSANAQFREIAEFFQQVQYLHLVPQLVKYPEAFRGRRLAGDPFGMDFLESVAKAPAKVRDGRLRKIDRALAQVVPHFRELTYRPDELTGVPHLQVKFDHWRGIPSNQREDQFSDGTLRLIGLLWSLLSGESLLLLEEPELSLHAGIVAQLAPLIRRLQKTKSGLRQVILSTHSEVLLRDETIDPSEVLLLVPGKEGTTQVRPASDDDEVEQLLNGGMNMADVIMPKTVARDTHQLLLTLDR
ncbi:MAG TPA: AAA family ATPase [Opitutaceae bacterium]|nr:AAA family ATPase [Opitutaceae bacterium]